MVVWKGEETTTIAVTTKTRDALALQKRGGESFNSLVRKMMAQYEPYVGDPPDDGLREPYVGELNDGLTD